MRRKWASCSAPSDVEPIFPPHVLGAVTLCICWWGSVGSTFTIQFHFPIIPGDVRIWEQELCLLVLQTGSRLGDEWLIRMRTSQPQAVARWILGPFMLRSVSGGWSRGGADREGCAGFCWHGYCNSLWLLSLDLHPNQNSNVSNPHMIPHTGGAGLFQTAFIFFFFSNGREQPAHYTCL
jgi:hypothetical protein